MRGKGGEALSENLAVNVKPLLSAVSPDMLTMKGEKLHPVSILVVGSFRAGPRSNMAEHCQRESVICVEPLQTTHIFFSVI